MSQYNEPSPVSHKSKFSPSTPRDKEYIQKTSIYSPTHSSDISLTDSSLDNFTFDKSSYFSIPLQFSSAPSKKNKTSIYPIFVPCDSLSQKSKVPVIDLDSPLSRKRNRINSVSSVEVQNQIHSIESYLPFKDEMSEFYQQPEYSESLIIFKSLFLASVVPGLAILIVFSLSYFSFCGEKVQMIRQILG